MKAILRVSMNDGSYIHVPIATGFFAQFALALRHVFTLHKTLSFIDYTSGNVFVGCRTCAEKDNRNIFTTGDAGRVVAQANARVGGAQKNSVCGVKGEKE